MNEPRTPFGTLVKPAGPLCNLDCVYCFYLEKERLYGNDHGTRNWVMSEEILESYTKQYIQAQDAPLVSFAWQGGEPTLTGLDFFRKAVELQQKYAAGKQIENTLQTNGTLLDDLWCEFFARNNFLIGLSIDGPRKMHDRYRRDRGGAPTFDKVMRGMDVLKKHGVQFNTLTAVQRHNSRYPLEVYRFLKGVGSGFMQFIPVVERTADASSQGPHDLIAPGSDEAARVSDWSVEPAAYGKFLCTIFDEWVRNDVGSIYVQLFDVALEAWVEREPSLCVWRRTCGDAIVVEHNGDVYSCDHYVYPQNLLGNLLRDPLPALLRSPKQLKFGQDKLNALPTYCRKCEVLFACNGECPKHRFAIAPDGEPGLNYLCPAYKRFFTHVDPYMRFMANELACERPPANVMLWARGEDVRAAESEGIGRNDPCPCGSGRKYKKCCGDREL